MDPDIRCRASRLATLRDRGTPPRGQRDVLDLHGITLPRADFTGFDLRTADFTDGDLTGTVLHDADLEGADLTDADLSECDLSDARLDGAVLVNTTLDGADLRTARGLTEDQLRRTRRSAATSLPPDLG